MYRCMHLAVGDVMWCDIGQGMTYHIAYKTLNTYQVKCCIMPFPVISSGNILFSCNDVDSNIAASRSDQLSEQVS